MGAPLCLTRVQEFVCIKCLSSWCAASLSCAERVAFGSLIQHYVVTLGERMDVWTSLFYHARGESLWADAVLISISRRKLAMDTQVFRK